MKYSIAGLLLAAGMSRRSGSTNKLLASVDGNVMVASSLRALTASQCTPVYVVTGHQAVGVREALMEQSALFIHNNDYAEGMASSIRVGVMALDDNVDGVLIGLADMPHVRTETINSLVEAFSPDHDREICVPFYEGKPGNPVLFGRRYFRDLTNLQGDRGGKSVVQNNATQCVSLDVDDPGIHLDHDVV